MRQDLIVSKSIDVNANLSTVWQALTTPEIIKEYLFGTETVTDWQVGSPIIFQGEYEGHIYQDKGVILENILNEQLTYSYWSGFSGVEDKPENQSIITYTLTKIGDNQTRFTWTQKGYATEEVYHHSKDGMDEFLEQIKGIMER
ncbi:SRPBCC family protein [Spirosoma flavum]|uniref:SRPBCC domain-containing protein n=1 Tax=Spirosoma flavum TaxID=2048557 RepID=A0ABW6APF9_9BACT